MRFESSAPFDIKDENHLFEAMGLTKVTEGKLAEVFDPEINEYLKTSLLNSINQSKDL